jgi:hypothetical protein
MFVQNTGPYRADLKGIVEWLLYLALRNISQRSVILIKNWSGAINQFATPLEGRVPMGVLSPSSLTQNAV